MIDDEIIGIGYSAMHAVACARTGESITVNGEDFKAGVKAMQFHLARKAVKERDDIISSAKQQALDELTRQEHPNIMANGT